MPTIGARSISFTFALITLSLALPLFAQTAAVPPAPPDATLYNSYVPSVGYQNITWFVCGSTQTTEGCYASGTLGPFGTAGAMIEGNASANLTTGTVTRAIYVVDTATGSAGNGVTLYVYKQVETVTSSTVTVTITLTRTVPLPLVGGSSSLCSIAANNLFLFIGTDQSPYVLRVQKGNLAMAQFGGFEPPMNVSSVTSDKYGFVTATFGGFTSSQNGFIQFAPNGNSVGGGGGAWFMLNTMEGISTSTLPPSTINPAEWMVVRPKLQMQP
jgi:hypothetical protein